MHPLHLPAPATTVDHAFVASIGDFTLCVEDARCYARRRQLSLDEAVEFDGEVQKVLGGGSWWCSVGEPDPGGGFWCDEAAVYDASGAQGVGSGLEQEGQAGAFGDGDDTAVVTGFEPDDVRDVVGVVDLGEHSIV